METSKTADYVKDDFDAEKGNFWGDVPKDALKNPGNYRLITYAFRFRKTIEHVFQNKSAIDDTNVKTIPVEDHQKNIQRVVVHVNKAGDLGRKYENERNKELLHKAQKLMLTPNLITVLHCEPYIPGNKKLRKNGLIEEKEEVEEMEIPTADDQPEDEEPAPKKKAAGKRTTKTN